MLEAFINTLIQVILIGFTFLLYKAGVFDFGTAMFLMGCCVAFIVFYFISYFIIKFL